MRFPLRKEVEAKRNLCMKKNPMLANARKIKSPLSVKVFMFPSFPTRISEAVCSQG